MRLELTDYVGSILRTYAERNERADVAEHGVPDQLFASWRSQAWWSSSGFRICSVKS